MPTEEGVGVDVTKRKLLRGQSLSRSAPGEVSRGGVVLMVFMFKLWIICFVP